MTGRVVVVGSSSRDITLLVDVLPGPGATVLATSVHLGFGGKGANQAVAAALAGADVAMVGRLGADDTGEQYRDRFERFGIDVTEFRAVPGRTSGTAYITVDASGENSIVVDPGANSALRPEDLGPLDGLGPGDVVLLQCEIPLETVAAAVRAAHGAGARVALNLAPYVELPADVLSLADPLVVNEDEAVLLRQAGAESAPRSLVVTLGAAGARWDDLALPGVEVPAADVVDTTGAGDAFCGALAAALATGADREAVLAAALQAGADAVRRLGAQPDPA